MPLARQERFKFWVPTRTNPAELRVWFETDTAKHCVAFTVGYRTNAELNNTHPLFLETCSSTLVQNYFVGHSLHEPWLRLPSVNGTASIADASSVLRNLSMTLWFSRFRYCERVMHGSWPSQVHCKDNCRPSRTCDFVPSTLRMHPTDPMPLMLMQLNCRNHNWHNLRIWQFQDTQFRGPVLWCEMAGCGNRASTCGSQGETIVIGHEYTYTDTVLCAVHFLVSITALTCWQMFNCQRL